MSRVAGRLHGVALVATATLAWSTIGLTARLVATDAWTTVFWRGLAGALVVGGLVWRWHGPALPGIVRRMGWPGAAVTAASVAGTVLFMLALKLGSVAHVAIVYATTPFLAAGLAWLATGERTSGSALVASALAALGVLVTVAGSLDEGRLAGDLLALAMAVAFAAMMVLLRRHGEVPMVPTAGLAALGSAAVGGSLCAPLEAAPGDIACLALAGALQTGLGDMLFTRGAQAVPAAQTALIGTLEGPLAALWVWLLVGEAPSGPTLLGGGIVLGAVLGHVGLEHAAGMGLARVGGRLGRTGRPGSPPGPRQGPAAVPSAARVVPVAARRPPLSSRDSAGRDAVALTVTTGRSGGSGGTASTAGEVAGGSAGTGPEAPAGRSMIAPPTSSSSTW